MTIGTFSIEIDGAMTRTISISNGVDGSFAARDCHECERCWRFREMRRQQATTTVRSRYREVDLSGVRCSCCRL